MFYDYLLVTKAKIVLYFKICYQKFKQAKQTLRQTVIKTNSYSLDK